MSDRILLYVTNKNSKRERFLIFQRNLNTNSYDNIDIGQPIGQYINKRVFWDEETGFILRVLLENVQIYK